MHKILNRKYNVMTCANTICTINSDEDILLIFAITQIEHFVDNNMLEPMCNMYTAAENTSSSSSQSTHNLRVVSTCIYIQECLGKIHH